MTQFKAMFVMNLKRRMTDGFALGYNIIFPLIMIGLLGFVSKGHMFGTISGYKYYQVVMIPFTTIIGMVTAAYAAKDDAYAKTAERVLCAPVSIPCIVVSKVVAEVIVFVICACFTLVVSELLWNGEMFSNLPLVLLQYLGISIFAAGIGTFIGLGMKNFMVIKNFMSVPIGVLAVLGGCFFRIGAGSTKIGWLCNLSPFTWINRSLFQLLYDKKAVMIVTVSAIFAVIGLVFAYLAMKRFKKEEYIYGELPGYEK